MTGRGTPLRSVRIENTLWCQARWEAARRGESVSEVIRRALAEYLRAAFQDEERPGDGD